MYFYLFHQIHGIKINLVCAVTRQVHTLVGGKKKTVHTENPTLISTQFTAQHSKVGFLVNLCPYKRVVVHTPTD